MLLISRRLSRRCSGRCYLQVIEKIFRFPGNAHTRQRIQEHTRFIQVIGEPLVSHFVYKIPTPVNRVREGR
jgi:hypothetical protein